jgi:hypothetical protein
MITGNLAFFRRAMCLIGVTQRSAAMPASHCIEKLEAETYLKRVPTHYS